jgi:hypothetical protein
MFGKKDSNKDPLDTYREQISNLLLDGEIIENIYPLFVDFLCITNKRLLFVDKDLSLTKPKTSIYSIPFKKIEGVALEKNEKLFAYTDEIEITTKAKKHSLKFAKNLDISQIYKNITAKTV